TENDREAQKRALLEMFGDVDNNPEHRYMESTLDKDTTMKTEDALLELYRRVRPGDPPSVDNARNLLQSLFFNPRRFDLGRVGRYKVDKRLGRDEEDILARVRQRELRILEKGDFIAFLRKLIELNNAPREKQIPDDIDHLGNRRVRAVGERLQHLPDRDPRGSEHRTDRQPRHVREGERVRVRRDAVPPRVQPHVGQR